MSKVFLIMYFAVEAVLLCLIRTALFAVCLIILMIAGMLNLTNALGVLDITLVLVNVIIAWTSARERTPLLFRIGLTLFLCGDLAIMIRTLTTGTLHDGIDLLEWVLYLPSQVLITLSYIKRDQRTAKL